MSRVVYFTANGSNGFQLSQEAMDTLQTELQDLIKAFICVTGNNVILCGVVGPSGGSIYTEGLVVWNNEFFFFEGGAFGQYLVVNEQTTQLNVCDNNNYDAYTIRTLRFQSSVDPGDTYIEPTNVSGLGIFNFLSTIDQMTQDIITNTTNITNNYNDLSQQITDLTTIVTNNALLDNSEIGDTRYIKSIANFDGSGLGTVGTNREKWALVTDANAQWKTALGFGGSFNDIDGRTLVIAGTKYSVLTQFGTDDHTLSESEMPIHNHDFSGNTSVTGEHDHDILEYNNVGVANGVVDFKNIDASPVTGSTDDQGIQPAGDHSHSFNGTTDNKGGGNAHENRQPSISLYMMVKYQA